QPKIEVSLWGCPGVARDRASKLAPNLGALPFPRGAQQRLVVGQFPHPPPSLAVLLPVGAYTKSFLGAFQGSPRDAGIAGQALHFSGRERSLPEQAIQNPDRVPQCRLVCRSCINEVPSTAGNLAKPFDPHPAAQLGRAECQGRGGPG